MQVTQQVAFDVSVAMFGNGVEVGIGSEIVAVPFHRLVVDLLAQHQRPDGWFSQASLADLYEVQAGLEAAAQQIKQALWQAATQLDAGIATMAVAS